MRACICSLRSVTVRHAKFRKWVKPRHSLWVGELVRGVVMSFSCCFFLGGERIIKGRGADTATISRTAYAARRDSFEFLCL